MRTAVIRINIDPHGTLESSAIQNAIPELVRLTDDAGISIVDTGVAFLPSNRRELQFLATGDDPAVLQKHIAELCRTTFGTSPAAGVVTFMSRGTDEDALGVLTGLGVSGEVFRTPTEDEWDIVTVRVTKADLARTPESRIQTALEASLNCEVRVVAM